MRCGENKYFWYIGDDLASQWMQCGDSLNFITEHFNSYGEFFIHRNNFDGVATYSKSSPLKSHVISLILNIDKVTQ